MTAHAPRASPVARGARIGRRGLRSAAAAGVRFGQCAILHAAELVEQLTRRLHAALHVILRWALDIDARIATREMEARALSHWTARRAAHRTHEAHARPPAMVRARTPIAVAILILIAILGTATVPTIFVLRLVAGSGHVRLVL